MPKLAFFLECSNESVSFCELNKCCLFTTTVNRKPSDRMTFWHYRSYSFSLKESPLQPVVENREKFEAFWVWTDEKDLKMDGMMT